MKALQHCTWFGRWRHRQLRFVDVEFMWRSFYERADNIETARVAWEVFLRQEGQEHWWCSCGQPIRELFSVATIMVTTVEE